MLVADDDPGIIDALKVILEEFGYLVATTNNGQTVQDVKDELPDLILLDIWMSGMDGGAICKHLKSQKETKNIPIIMVSANRDTETITREAGADDFIAKPFQMEELITKVEKYLK